MQNKYVPEECRKTIEEVTSILKNMKDNDITPKVLLMVDYAYHNTDNDYEDGLSFLNRLHTKLSRCFLIEFDLYILKQKTSYSNNPSVDFLDGLNKILTDKMIEYYGV